MYIHDATEVAAELVIFFFFLFSFSFLFFLFSFFWVSAPTRAPARAGRILPLAYS